MYLCVCSLCVYVCMWMCIRVCVYWRVYVCVCVCVISPLDYSQNMLKIIIWV